MAFLRPDLAELGAYVQPAHALPQIDPLDTNENPLDLPDDLKVALSQRYRHEISANRYPDGSHQALKTAVLSYVAESAGLSPADLNADHISLGSGSDELIRSLLIATCLGRRGAILVAVPTFSMYAVLAQTLDIPVVSVGRSEQRFEIDLAAAERAIATQSEPPIRVVFAVHPNSPTGNALTAAERAWLEQLPSDILVVVDEAYFEFSQQTTVAAALARPNWVVLRTFSKAFRLAAHRLGYAIAQPPLIAALEKIRLPYNLPSFSQAAGLAALAERNRLLAQIPSLLDSRERLFTALAQQPELRLWPSQSNFIYLRPSDRGLRSLGTDSSAVGQQRLFEQLLDRGTLVRHTGGGLRVSIGTELENQRTMRHFQELLTDPTAHRPAASGASQT
ncbi:histidinol-phosphate transaminase [Romeria aff. gracilis LEGE 07310]|uniref:Histidinol-phosphate aminotransferase n=1 Tax=Vasconcelosia minhoensis LEGE 07310 TaxID=915328 RepID=A0A8J7DMG3_9CYAN|nr:histidinol-phosphate transaminase [Romeria gracilis]MBE9076610.1 histidinol-phosphate transaminase [Romeria aff. gracilis LEGE 07310]